MGINGLTQVIKQLDNKKYILRLLRFIQAWLIYGRYAGATESLSRPSQLDLDFNRRPEFYLMRSEAVRGARSTVDKNLRLDGVRPVPSTKMTTACDFTWMILTRASLSTVWRTELA